MLKNQNRIVLWILILFLITSCFEKESEHQWNLAQEKKEQGLHLEALSDFNKIIKRFKGDEIALKASKEAASIAIFQLKDHRNALPFLKYQVLFSSKSEDVRKAQESIADIYFTHLNEYKQSVIEYNRLVETSENKDLKSSYELQIARAYFFLKNFFQAEMEITRILGHEKIKEDIKYQALVLRGNIAMTEKKTDRAIKIFSSLIENYPERSKRDSISLNLAICYEEKENFARAIEILDEMKSDYRMPSFLEAKIKKLKVRQSFLPGAKGLKK